MIFKQTDVCVVVDQKMLLSENIYFDIIKTGTERLAIYKNRVLCGPLHFYMTFFVFVFVYQLHNLTCQWVSFIFLIILFVCFLMTTVELFKAMFYLTDLVSEAGQSLFHFS